jgi:hypothetical protein
MASFACEETAAALVASPAAAASGAAAFSSRLAVWPSLRLSAPSASRAARQRRASARQPRSATAAGARALAERQQQSARPRSSRAPRLSAAAGCSAVPRRVEGSALGRTAAQSGSTGAELAGHGRAFARLLRHASDPAARSCTLRTQTRRPPAGAAPSDARQLRRAQQMQRFVLSGAVLCVLGTVRPSDAVACLCCGTRHATTLRPKRQGDGR